jgi:hypothetical protein
MGDPVSFVSALLGVLLISFGWVGLAIVVYKVRMAAWRALKGNRGRRYEEEEK